MFLIIHVLIHVDKTAGSEADCYRAIPDWVSVFYDFTERFGNPAEHILNILTRPRANCKFLNPADWVILAQLFYLLYLYIAHLIILLQIYFVADNRDAHCFTLILIQSLTNPFFHDLHCVWFHDWIYEDDGICFAEVHFVYGPVFLLSRRVPDV